MGEKLSPKQQRFVDEFLVDMNGKQAAIRSGYSPKTAEVQASRLLSNAKVMEAVQARRDELSRATEITQENVLRELAYIAFASGEDLCEFPLPKLGDKVKSLELLGKHLGLLERKTDAGNSEALAAECDNLEVIE